MANEEPFIERTIGLKPGVPEDLDEALTDLASACLAYLDALIKSRAGVEENASNLYLWVGVVRGSADIVHRKTMHLG